VELKLIGHRSRIFGTIITPSGKLRGKMTKMRQKVTKNWAKIVLFFLYIFRIYSLKTFEGGGLGGMAPSNAPSSLLTMPLV